MADRKLQNGAGDGYFCISDTDGPLLQGEIDEKRQPEVWISCGDTVTIDKMFGPLNFWSIRVTPVFETCEWVIERHFGPQGEWREVARIPGQIDEDFTDHD